MAYAITGDLDVKYCVYVPKGFLVFNGRCTSSDGEHKIWGQLGAPLNTYHFPLFARKMSEIHFDVSRQIETIDGVKRYFDLIKFDTQGVCTERLSHRHAGGKLEEHVDLEGIAECVASHQALLDALRARKLEPELAEALRLMNHLVIQ